MLKKLKQIYKATLRQFYISYKFTESVKKSTKTNLFKKPDIIFCREALSAYTVWWMSLRYPKAKIILDACEYPIMSGRGSVHIRNMFFTLKLFNQLMDRLIARKADLILSTGDIATEQLERRYNKEVTLFKNFKNKFDKEKDRSVLKEYGYEEGDIFLVCPGQPDQCARTLFSVKILAELPDNYKLLIIGAQANKHYIKSIEEKVEELSVGDRVTISPALAGKDYHKVLNASDLALILFDTRIDSLKSWSPNRFMDCMTAKVPLVTCDNEEFKKVFSEYGNGEIFDHNSPQQVAHLIESMFENGKIKTQYTEKLQLLADNIQIEKVQAEKNLKEKFTQIADGKSEEKNILMVARADISENLRSYNICNLLTDLGFEIESFSTRIKLKNELLKHPQKITSNIVEI